MSFHVDWTPHARRQMREIWARASVDVHQRLLAALAEIAEALTLRPTEVGESRSGNARIGFVGPLSIIYRVDVDRRTVRISHVKFMNS